jgi:catechol 2,3-dioxygenase-like lactoylglutathione lyase family enzyme
MTILGIDEITYRVSDLPRSRRFFEDFGLRLEAGDDRLPTFSTLNGGRVKLRLATDCPAAGIEDGPTVVQVIWGVSDSSALGKLAARLRGLSGFREEAGRLTCIDPNGLSVGFQVSTRKHVIGAEGQLTNTWNRRPRIDAAAPVYDRALPIEIGHIVFHVGDLDATVGFYRDVLGFAVSDRYPGTGVFLRCNARGGHHDLFLLRPPSGQRGLNHVAFAVRDIYEVIGGGMHMDRLGWRSEIGPGRHPVSSATFWYFPNPAGALAEYYADDDELTESWQPRDFVPNATVFAEWAIAGGIDGQTRRQHGIGAPPARFITDKAAGD